MCNNLSRVRWLCLILFLWWVHPTGAALAGSPGFLSVTGPCHLTFPGDHGAHPGFRTEWWYYTGNLTATSGERFGFQLDYEAIDPHDLTLVGPLSRFVEEQTSGAAGKDG